MLASCIWCPLAQAKGKWCLEINVLIDNWLFTEYVPEKLIWRFKKKNPTYFNSSLNGEYLECPKIKHSSVSIHVANNSDYEYTPV